jgi:filamentous hemagglutinin
LSSSGDEHNVETHSKDGKKRVHEQDDHTVQKAAEFIAGGDVKTSSGRDTTLIASKISAGNEAYVYAGNDLNLLAAQNKDHTLYDMKEKGGFGNLKLQRDEVTQVTHVGSEIKTGGNLSLVSLGDQHYQVAKLDSGKDILLDSGGTITFEGVKDLHDESHTKTNNNAAWVSTKGRGNTDETLRQTQMIAKGNIVLKAVDGLKIDIKDVSQESVSQTIDAMVKADPQLAWLKDAEARGDVDWRRVKEIHESFKYSNSGLGPASQMIIAIVMAAFVGPAAFASLSASMGTAWAAGLAAVATGAATNATTSFINNGGNLGAVFADVTSSDALKGYVISGVTAGLMAEYLNQLTGMKYDPNTGKLLGPSLATWEGVGRFAGSQIIQGGTSALITKAVGGDASAGDVLKTALFNTVAAFSFNMVGDLTQGVLDDGSAGKIIIHAAVGGLLSEMTGGDFATGALAAGANEALVGEMNKWFKGNPELLLMGSQIVGVLSATALGNTDQESLENASWVANNATQYNFLNHQDVKDLEKALKECKDNCDAVRAEFAKRDADNTARLNNCWATGDCAQIKAEIDEGSLALNKLWENDDSGITDQFLHSNIADSTNARTRAVLDHLPKGDPANAVKLLAAAGIIALAPEAIGLLGQLATRGAATCAANPVLCANEVAIWTAEAGMSEALPVGLGATAGGAAAKELSDLRGLMEIEAKTGAKLTAEQIAAVVRPAAIGSEGAATVGGQATSTFLKDFGEKVLSHNTQIGVRNSKAGTISGAHNSDAFLESVEKTGAKISNKTTDVRYPGLVEYSYQLPKTNTRDELVGGYKSKSTKTTYDSKILSDIKVADMSSRAAVEAGSLFRANPAMREASIKVDGYYFQVTRDSKTGDITNSFITMPPRTK